MSKESFYSNVERIGNNILWRGYSNGNRFERKIKFTPTLYIPTKDSETEYRSLIGEHPIKPKTFENISEMRDFVEKYKDVSGFDVYGSSDPITQFIQEKYPEEVEFDFDKLNICYYDIEYDSTDGFCDVNTAEREITSISFKSSKTDTYHLLTLKDYDKNLTETGISPENIMHMKFDSEIALLERFIQIWTYNYPDIISGWNVEYFDIMYTVTRIKKVLGDVKANMLSPWSKIEKRTRELFGKSQSTYKIYGVSVVDYMDAFKKFGFKYGTQASYKLDHIANTVLGEKKIDYSEYGSLAELYRQDPQKYLDYSLKDTYLIQRIEEESGLLSLALTVAYSAGVNYNDAFGTVGIWESILYRKLMGRNIVPTVKSGPGDDSAGLIGGYVKDPDIGLHNWIVSFDLDSLYPHLMLQYNMSPETYIPNRKEIVSIGEILNGKYQNNDPSVSVCANGACFSNKKQGIIPEIIDEYYSDRKKIKKEMLRFESQVEKLKQLKSEKLVGK